MLAKNPRILVPNFFTSFNMIVGFASLYYAFGGNFTTAAWLILLSAILDKLDGTTARLFNASSDFGVEFDSFSDFFSFGITPGMLFFTYFYYQNNKDIELMPSYIKVGVAIYILFTAIRLAKFNSTGKDDKEYFYGLTSTQSGAMLASFFLFSANYSLPFLMDQNIIGGMLVAHSILLISNFKYPKLKKRKSNLFNMMQVGMLILLVFLVIFRKLPEVLYLTGLIYFIGGILHTRIKNPQTHLPEKTDEE